MDRQTAHPTTRGTGRRKPRPITKARLERIALQHIERYPSSQASLRRVLERRVRRARDELGGEATEHSAWIDSVVLRLVDLGLLDDRVFAKALTRRLRARGSSRRLILARLAEKGVDEEIRRSVLADDPDAEQAAATTYVRRRRLGPHRLDASVRAERRNRDLAALARAGFSHEVARRALDDDGRREHEEAFDPSP